MKFKKYLTNEQIFGQLKESNENNTLILVD